MQLDVLIPTYNRCDLLAGAVRSLLRAEVPDGLKVRITVIDNNSTDRTRQTVEALQQECGAVLHYVLETVQGRAAALNRGIVSTCGDLIGMIDDDEEVRPDWYKVVHTAFLQRPELSFIGGPYLPARDIKFPKWLPMPSYRGVIGWMESGNCEREFGSDGGILLGGNAVIRRAAFERVGLYNPQLGRKKNRLMSMEDQDMYERFVASGEKGVYLPSLVIYHHIPALRLTKMYHRKWCFWTGVSIGIRERTCPSRLPKILRMPRYRIRQAATSGIEACWGLLNWAKPSHSFAKELDVWTFLGVAVGLYFWKVQENS